MPNAAQSSDLSPQRDFALVVVRKLRDAGYESLWAGGCVRDQLLGRPPKDYDVATSALPEQVRQVFGYKRTLAIGAAFGVITVLGPKPAGQIEVATFRNDESYSDGRRPDAVTFSTAEEDALRRDFTINGLFFDPVEEKLVDYVGGQQDLQAKVIRAIGDPQLRIAEDKLRMLRAARFASTLGFDLDEPTARAVRANAAAINLVSAERIGSELERMLTSDGGGLAVRLLHELELLPHVVPATGGISAADLEKRAGVLDRLQLPTLPAALCCLLLAVQPRDVRATAQQLKYPNKVIDRCGWIAEQLPHVADFHRLPWSELQPIASHQGAPELLATYQAIHGQDPSSRCLHAKLALPAIDLDPPLLLTGDDLVREGLRPGPHFGGILQAVRTAQLDGELESREDALRHAIQLAGSVDD